MSLRRAPLCNTSPSDPLACHFSLWQYARSLRGTINGDLAGVCRECAYLPRPLPRESNRAVSEAKRRSVLHLAEGLPVERRRRRRGNTEQGRGRFRGQVEVQGPFARYVHGAVLGRRDQTGAAETGAPAEARGRSGTGGSHPAEQGRGPDGGPRADAAACRSDASNRRPTHGSPGSVTPESRKWPRRQPGAG